MLSPEAFLSEIEDFLSESGMSASAFGKVVVGDPNFVGDLRKGRMPNLRLVGKVSNFIRTAQPEHARAS
jgi:hypothetical protein